MNRFNHIVIGAGPRDVLWPNDYRPTRPAPSWFWNQVGRAAALPCGYRSRLAASLSRRQNHEPST